MADPTPAQDSILSNTSRLRLVRAVPGSGKTWLIAEAIRRSLISDPNRGIAALSFTRIGGKEIKKTLGTDLAHPHFCGTIDSFAFRFVVRPFMQIARPSYSAPRLIPSEWQPNVWSKPPNGIEWLVRPSDGTKQPYNLFDITYSHGEDGSDTLQHPLPFKQSLSVLPKDHQTLVMTAKRIIWEKTGMLTHADVGFIARKLITGKQKSLLTRILRTRFPFLIVDELQDTGYCQGSILHALIDNDIGSSLLVGDPDQAIYAFNGARPDLFDAYARISGMKVLPLSGSRRCPQAILNVANQLKDTPGEVTSENTSQGQAHFLLIDDPASDVRRLFDALSAAAPGKTVSVVTRTIRQRAILLRQTEAKSYKLHAPALTYLFSAVCAFRRGENRAASGLVRAALDLALFDYEGASDSQLADIGLDINSYQLLISRCLISCTKIPDSLTLYQWQKQSALVLKELLAPYSTPDSQKYREGKVGPKQVNGHDVIASDLLPAQPLSDSDATVLRFEDVANTVHGVKGETHDTTIFVLFDEDEDRCVSTVWWGKSDDQREEKRIAFVACTRARELLLVCASAQCRDRLANKTTFLKPFQVSTIDEYLSQITPQPQPGD